MREKERDTPGARSWAAARHPDTRCGKRKIYKREVKTPEQNVDNKKQVKL